MLRGVKHSQQSSNTLQGNVNLQTNPKTGEITINNHFY